MSAIVSASAAVKPVAVALSVGSAVPYALVPLAAVTVAVAGVMLNVRPHSDGVVAERRARRRRRRHVVADRFAGRAGRRQRDRQRIGRREAVAVAVSVGSAVPYALVPLPAVTVAVAGVMLNVPATYVTV